MIAQSRAENRIDLKIAIKTKASQTPPFGNRKMRLAHYPSAEKSDREVLRRHRAVCIALDSGCRRKELPRLSVLLPLFRLLMDKGKTGHEACPGKGGAPLENGDRKGNVGIT